MAVTELAVLQLKPGKDWSDILPHIRRAAIEQAAWSGYPLYFFDVLEKPGAIVLLSGWRSIEAHSKWIESETNQNLIEALRPSLDVSNLLHLTIEPSPSWKDTRAIIYTKAEEKEQAEALEEAMGVTWKGEGTDTEGKVEGTFRLVAFASVDALGNYEKGKKNTIRLIRHDISDNLDRCRVNEKREII